MSDDQDQINESLEDSKDSNKTSTAADSSSEEIENETSSQAETTTATTAVDNSEETTLDQGDNDMPLSNDSADKANTSNGKEPIDNKGADSTDSNTDTLSLDKNSNIETLEDEGFAEFESMDMATLNKELENLITQEPTKALKDKVEAIKKAFNSKYNETKKLAEAAANNESDEEAAPLYFESSDKRIFDKLYRTYQQKRKIVRRELETKLQENLKIRQQIIEDIKSLFESSEEMAEIYKTFKTLQKKWRSTGAVPRLESNNLWQTYHHHVENFYTFLHLNREFRDLDFKHNLDQKLKIIELAEELATKPFTNKVFRELQTLHKMWKEELGPVHKEHSEDTWKRFQDATKIIHDKRLIYNASLDENYAKNLVEKQQIVSQINAHATKPYETHKQFQQASSTVQKLRDHYFEIGKVPAKDRDTLWESFKDATRTFNRNKNKYFKSQKKEQLENLNKKKDLVRVAEEHMNSSDHQIVTPLMKRIQHEWKSIGQVPRKDSDKIWKQFKNACNTYFENLKKDRNGDTPEAIEALKHKTEFLKNLKEKEIPTNRTEALNLVKSITSEWNGFGRVQKDSKDIDAKFKKFIEKTLKGLDLSKEEIQNHVYESKLRDMFTSNDTRSFDYEQIQLRKKIDEITSEIRQLENNLQFFSNVASDNPMVADVHKNIDKKRTELDSYQSKMTAIRKMIREEDED